MFRFTYNVITNYSDHPLLVSMFLLAALFATAGVIVQELTGNGVASAFLVIYAMFAGFMGAAGYAILFGARLTTRLYGYVGPA